MNFYQFYSFCKFQRFRRDVSNYCVEKFTLKCVNLSNTIAQIERSASFLVVSWLTLHLFHLTLSIVSIQRLLMS